MPRNKVDVAAILGGQLAKVSDSDTPVRLIPLAQIHSNPRNFYPGVENLEDLEESIQANGLLEPLTVVPDEGGGYRLISGHNRFAALRRIHSAKYEDGVPCLVLPAMDECPETGGFCPHAQDIYDQDFHGGVWHGAGCCQQCLARDTCQAACGFARPHEPEEGAGGIAPPPKLENRVELSAEDWQVWRERFSERLRAARESTGLDRAAFAEKIGEYKATYSAWENGNLPGSSAFPRLAQALGVSTDYLYGLTDDPAPKPAPAQWQPLDEAHWPADGQLVAIAYENPLGGTCYLSARCVGGYHDIYPFEDTDMGCELDEPSRGDYEAGYWWMPLPEKEERPNA